MKLNQLRQLIREEIENVLNKDLPPIEKKTVKGQINAKKRQQELINRGYKLGKDFTVVQDPNNKIMYNISPIKRIEEEL